MAAQGNERGGRKPNAGRKPGRDYRGALPEAATSAHARSKAVRGINGADDPALLTVASMRARGRQWKEIAEAIERDEDTCKRWLAAYPEVAQAAVAELVGASPRQAFAPLVPAAFGAYAEILEDPTHKDRFSAATKVHEYIFDKPVTRTEFTGVPTPSITIISQTINNPPGSLTSPDTIEADFLLLEDGDQSG
jgi:hypothetical protein